MHVKDLGLFQAVPYKPLRGGAYVENYVDAVGVDGEMRTVLRYEVV
jgi:hypothetical protein